jgi:hypothetical protein
VDLTKPIYFELANFNTVKSICKGFFKILINALERPNLEPIATTAPGFNWVLASVGIALPTEAKTQLIQ